MTVFKKCRPTNILTQKTPQKKNAQNRQVSNRTEDMTCTKQPGFV